MKKKLKKKFKYLEKEKTFFIDFKGFSLKQIKQIFMEAESPSLR